MFPRVWVQVPHFGQEYQRKDSVSFSVYPVGRHMMSLCLLIDDLDPLVEVLSARFLCYNKVTVFFFVLYLVGDML